jgi:hypothetical protein
VKTFAAISWWRTVAPDIAPDIAFTKPEIASADYLPIRSGLSGIFHTSWWTLVANFL